VGNKGCVGGYATLQDGPFMKRQAGRNAPYVLAFLFGAGIVGREWWGPCFPWLPAKMRLTRVWYDAVAFVATPFKFMKFRFTYDGQLHASSTNSGPRPDDQWRIRRQLHPQLTELWRTHPALTGLAFSVYVQTGGGLMAGHRPIDVGSYRIPGW
jgi:hypothetical protein